MILKDITGKPIHKQQSFYMFVTVTLPLMMIMMLIFYNHVLSDMSLVQGNYCLSSGLTMFDPLIALTVLGVVVLIHITDAVIIIVLSYLLYQVYRMQKIVDYDSKRLLLGAVGFVAVVGISEVIIVLVLEPYDLIATVIFSISLETLMITEMFHRILRIQESCLSKHFKKLSICKLILTTSWTTAAINVL